MREALEHWDDDWLITPLSDRAFWQPFLLCQGRPVEYDVADAIQRLAVGEFDIAYVRGLATTLQGRGKRTCLVYRASAAYQPRGECSSWAGRAVKVADVLAGHRARYVPPPGDRNAFMIPSGPKCHHSITANPVVARNRSQTGLDFRRDAVCLSSVPQRRVVSGYFLILTRLGSRSQRHRCVNWRAAAQCSPESCNWSSSMNREKSNDPGPAWVVSLTCDGSSEAKPLLASAAMAEPCAKATSATRPAVGFFGACSMA